MCCDQEKLGQYLDVVETCLLKQIASRSQHFFEALTTLQVCCLVHCLLSSSSAPPPSIPSLNQSTHSNTRGEQDVRDRVAQACQQVHRLRTGLNDIDRKTVMGMIRIPRLAQRKVRVASRRAGASE